MSEQKKRPTASTLVPYVIENTGQGERSMDIYSRLLKDRIIFIGQEINDLFANIVIAQMLFLRMEDPKKDINLYIHSPGGMVSAGLAIYDTMQHLPCDVNTWCIGMSASMGALLLASGTKGKRHALPNSRIMIHQPSGGIGGTSEDIRIQAKEMLYLKQRLNEILADHTGQTVERIAKDSERDYYMSPEEAMEYGLVDQVVSPQEKKS